MNIRKINEDTRHTLLRTFTAVIAVAVITYTALSSTVFTELAASLLAKNAFYIPTKNNISFTGRDILRSACFGGEFYDIEEKTIILNNKTSTPKSNAGSDVSFPENALDPDLQHSQRNMLPIVDTDLSTEQILTLNNTTGKRPDTELLLYSDYDFGYEPGSTDPLILILHTHATECYSREESSSYDTDSTTRSNDPNVNMIAVGKVLADTLNEEGIVSLHCTVMHDESSYSDSYALAANSIKEYLKKYPSIRYVFDLHRDAVMYESGAKARATTEIDGQTAAQIMLLVGTDAGGASFPDWEKNLSLALKLADKMSGEYPSLMRSIALRGASYNEQYTNGSLLIELGTDGNTLSHAKYSARLLGKALAELIKGDGIQSDRH